MYWQNPKEMTSWGSQRGSGYFYTVTSTSETQPSIFTPHLVLEHIAADRLILLFEDPENELVYKDCAYTNPHRELIDFPGPLHWRAPQVKEDAALNKWFLRWLVLRDVREIVGSISFHGAPNDVGMIEIGLGVNPKFQGRGYAREALIGMWSWVVEQPGVEVLRYTVSAANVASMKLIDKYGFTHIGVQIDERDGPEEIFELSAHEFRSRYAVPWSKESTIQ
jgi:[ribosomal protein S5]-alanine N-acetyltransferase